MATEPRRWGGVQVVVTVLVVLAALKGLRVPSRWAATHLLFNYSEGFLRRGLVGQTLRLVGHGAFDHYRALVALGFFCLVAWWALLLRLLVKREEVSTGSSVWNDAWVSMGVFASSIGCVFSMHEVGYLDEVALLVVLVALNLLPSLHRRSSLAGVMLAACACLLLVHEGQMLLGVPLVLFAGLCRSGAPPESPFAARGARLLPIVLPGLGALGILAIVCRYGTPSPERLAALRASLSARADFPLRVDAFAAIDHSVWQNYRADHWLDPGAPTFLLTSLLMAAPAWLYFVGTSLDRIRRARGTAIARGLLALGMVLVAAAPWALNVWGWDAMRWSALAVTSAFLSHLILILFVPVGRPAPTPRLTLAALAVILGLMTNDPGFLFDDTHIHWFPFAEQWTSSLGSSPRHFFDPPVH